MTNTTRGGWLGAARMVRRRPASMSSGLGTSRWYSLMASAQCTEHRDCGSGRGALGAARTQCSQTAAADTCTVPQSDKRWPAQRRTSNRPKQPGRKSDDQRSKPGTLYSVLPPRDVPCEPSSGDHQARRKDRTSPNDVVRPWAELRCGSGQFNIGFNRYEAM